MAVCACGLTDVRRAQLCFAGCDLISYNSLRTTKPFVHSKQYMSSEDLGLVEPCRQTAFKTTVPIEVEIGTGMNWLEAH